MEWTKENLRRLYFEKFGLSLTPDDLDYEWELSQTKILTPKGDRMNIAVSPVWIKTYIERELQRTGLTLEDSRFKKIREEIIPAIDYVLFLKKIGFGEHLICSSDSPDIVLINKENSSVPGMAYRRRVIPIEVTFINDESLKNITGVCDEERLVKVLEKNKLNKSYSPHTTLLVVIDTVFKNLDLEKIAGLLKYKGQNFHYIDLFIIENDDACLIASIYPKLATYDLNLKDLESLMY